MGTPDSENTDTRELTLNIDIDGPDEMTQALLTEVDSWRARDISVETTSTGATRRELAAAHRITLIGPAEQFVNLVSRPEAVKADKEIFYRGRPDPVSA